MTHRIHPLSEKVLAYPNTPIDIALEERHDSGELKDAIDFYAGWKAATEEISVRLQALAENTSPESRALLAEVGRIIREEVNEL